MSQTAILFSCYSKGNNRVVVKRCIKIVDNRTRNQGLFSGVLDWL
jgi:hypothetical protein